MLDKQDILDKTNNGLDFFKFVIPELSINGNKCNNVKNPFYEDTKAGLSIFNKNGQWFFNDFGDATYSGDMFKFAGFYYKINPSTNFHQLLENINNDLHLNLINTSSMKEKSKIEKQLYHIKNTNKKQAEEYLKSRKITISKHFYQANAYKKYPIAVVFVNHNETGLEKKIYSNRRRIEKTWFTKN